MDSRTSIEHCLKVVISRLQAMELPAYQYVAPQGTPYPFAVVTPVSASASLYTIGKAENAGRIDQPLFQVSAYTDQSAKCWDLSAKLQAALENIYETDDREGGFVIVGSWKAFERGPVPYSSGGLIPSHWSVSLDYRLAVTGPAKPAGQGDDWSSSSSSESSVSSQSSQSSITSISSVSSASSIWHVSQGTSQSSGSSQSSQSDIPLPSGQNRRAVVASIEVYSATPNDPNNIVGCMHAGFDTMASYLADKWGFTVDRLRDSQVTVSGIEAAIDYATSGMTSGDAFVLALGGHGVYASGARPDKPDGAGEDRYMYGETYWSDSRIRQVIDAIPEGVKVTVIFESCYSGTGTRVIQPKPRMITQEQMREVLLAGSQYNAESWASRVTGGAFTMAVNAALSQSGTGCTASQFWDNLMVHYEAEPLHEDSQIPQFEGSSANKSARAFV